MATIQKRGPSWILNWRQHGKQWRKSLGAVSHAEAKTILKAKELELETGQKILSSAPLFLEYAPEYLEWYAYEYPASYDRTELIVRLHLMPRFQYCALDTIGPRDVEQWKSERIRKVSAGTVTKELRVFKAMLNRAVDWDLIKAHPFRAVKAPKDLNSKPPRFYTSGEMQSIYGVAGDYRFVWQLLANTGLRRGEVQALRRQYVTDDRLRVISETDNRTKSGKWREVPLNAASKEALDNLGDDYIVPRVRGFSLTRAFRRSLNKSGLDGSLHCLRHTFCSHLVMAGVPLRTVQVLAGHANHKTTERYAHLAPDHLQNALGGIEI